MYFPFICTYLITLNVINFVTMCENVGEKSQYFPGICYEIFDEIRDLLSGLLSPIEKENFLGYAKIKQVFKVSKIGKIAGCIVTEGAIKRNTKLRILRDNVVIHSGDLDNLKRHSDEAKEVKEGLECGISIQNFNDIQVEDVIECYEIEKTPRKLVENNQDEY